MGKMHAMHTNKNAGTKIRTSPSRKLFNVCNTVVLTFLMLCCLLPFIHVLAVSVSDKYYIDAGLVTLLPKGFNLTAYQYLLTKSAFWRAFWNSIKVTVLGTALNMLLLVLTAYPLSKDKTRLAGRTVYAWYFFLTMLVGGGLIPTYILVMGLGLRDNILALILPGLSAFNLVLMINFFRQIPPELEEAARIDGAGHLQCLAKIYIPLSKPAIATLSLFCIVGHWNNWFSGMIYMSKVENQPLQTYLRAITLLDDRMTMLGADYAIAHAMSDIALNFAQIVVAMIPILCAYPFLQKYFVVGIKLGGVKG